MKQQVNPSYKYENINFEAFSKAPAQVLTRAEQERILRRFLKTQKQGRRRDRRHKIYAAAACLCLLACFLISPIGDKAMAAVKQAAVGIGQFLGMEQEDDFAMILDETQTKGELTLTLHEVVASDSEFRYSITGTKADGSPLGASQIDLAGLWINGEKVGWDIEGTGWGPFGSSQPRLAKTEEKGLHFYSSSYQNYEMPINPKVRMELYAGGKNAPYEGPFTFEFVLKNEAFKKATKRISIGRTISVHGKDMVLGELILSPIDQHITLKNWEDWEEDCEKGMDLTLFGTDDAGTEVCFRLWGGSGSMPGARADDGQGTYALNSHVKAYTLYPKYYVYPESDDEEGQEFVGKEKIVIKIE